MKKRGISPLIATVLLIGFTVALAVLVINWGVEYTKKTTEQTGKTTTAALKCATELNFDLVKFDCASGSITVDNKGAIDIKSIIFRVYKGNSVTPDLDAGKQGVTKFNVRGFTLAGGANADKIEALATIAGEEGSEDITCSQAPKAFETSC
ncbi:hypothetical protein HYT58_03170 [Candidatus Woesearchaeota archaeon]|nr:hypothetical protein [Candidatus Woesearchaeota archaeon]